MAYADFEYYANTYLGTTIEYNDFSRLSLRASAFLDYYTQGRAAKNAELDALKMCCCAIAEQYQYIDTAKALAQKSITSSLENNGELQSQTVGSWSKTYRSGGDSAQQALSSVQTAQAALATIAQQYLAGTGLLYRGRGCPCVPSCCDGL
nr:MAG TPA: Head Tail Connector Protein [Caudoviricetes sp.]